MGEFEFLEELLHLSAQRDQRLEPQSARREAAEAAKKFKLHHYPSFEHIAIPSLLW